jgi:hypothetical protein
MLRGLILFLTFLGIHAVQATRDSSLRYANAIYEPAIHTVRLNQIESGFNVPLVQVGESEALRLEFDEFNENLDYYQYTLIHCDAQWQPSALNSTQVLSGMGYEELGNPSFSTQTLTKYVHYSAAIPSQNVLPKVGGNYLLVVYRNYDLEDIVLSRRIFVLDTKGRVDQMLVSQSSQIELRRTHQEVDFNFIAYDNYFMPNPLQDLKVVIMRNMEWNSAITDLKPQYMMGKSFQYQHQVGNQFQGGNQYRGFDIRSTRTALLGVVKRYDFAGQKHIDLVTDQARTYERYFNWSDYNGRYFLDSRDVPLPGGVAFESDYCFVHFSLKADEREEPVYVYGELSDWQLLESHRLYYNPSNGLYEAVLPLKQGYYNYQYVVQDPSGALDFKPLEGSHGETENNYMVFVYHRNIQLGFDELIGYGLKNLVTNSR